MRKILTLGFVAGFLAVLVFHQGTAFLLNIHGNRVPELVAWIGRTGPAYSMMAVPPFGVPGVITMAFWGGLWGIALAALLRLTPVPDLFTGLLFGAVVVTLVGFAIATQGRGLPSFTGGSRHLWLQAALLNGAWGWGAAVLLRPLALRG